LPERAIKYGAAAIFIIAGLAIMADALMSGGS